MGLELHKYLEHQEVFLFFIIIIELFIIIILVLALFYRRRDEENDQKNKENISNIAKNSDSNYWENRYYQLEKDYYNLKDTNYYLNKELDKQRSKKELSSDWSNYAKKESGKGIYLKETRNDDGTIKSEIEFDDKTDEIVPIIMPPKYDYLEAANNGQFRKLLSSDEKCFFRTWEENGIRKFEFHGNIEKALANINAIFDDVCEIEGKQNGASNITNVEPGILDSKLKVEKPAKIKLT